MKKCPNVKTWEDALSVTVKAALQFLEKFSQFLFPNVLIS